MGPPPSPLRPLLAGGQPLRFYHFTGYDGGDGFGMLQQYAADQPLAKEIWDDYGRDLREAGHNDPKLQDWAFGRLENGDPISPELRKLYRFRKDLKDAFPDPFKVEGQCLWAWWRAETRT